MLHINVHTVSKNIAS